MQVYLVGGAIRDQLLGLEIKDKDWVVVGSTPQALLDKGFRAVGKDFPVFLHPDTNEEYALARTERKSGTGHQGFTFYAAPEISLEEDLKRRDLTINAIAQDEQGELIDPYHGVDDIQNKILRHVSPAFIEDPLRVLRVARFAARLNTFNFTVAPETQALMQTITNNGELATLSAERIWTELAKAFQTQTPWIFFQVLDKAQALKALFPEVDTDALDTLKAVTQKTNNLNCRFAATFYKCTQLGQLKAPKDTCALTVLIQKLKQDVFTFDPCDTHMLLKLIKQTDALRRPGRFQDFLIVIEAVGITEHCEDIYARCNTLKMAQKQLATLRFDQLAKQHTGKDLIKKIEQTQLNALSGITD